MSIEYRVLRLNSISYNRNNPPKKIYIYLYKIKAKLIIRL